MGKRRKMFMAFVLVMGALLLTSAVAEARPIELSLSLIIPPKHLRNINVLQPWAKMIEERTHGKVKITPYYSGALAPPPQTFNSIVSGVADIGEGIAYATPGRFPLTETIMLPELGLETSLRCSRALWHLYKKFPELKSEYSGVKMLWLHVTPAVKLITRTRPVYSLKDLKGLKIRVSGATAVKMGKALGFTPVSMPMGDLYLGLEKGVIDGVALPNEILISRRIGEVTKYVTDIDLGHDTFFVVMNEQTWNRLPKDVQKVFEELSGDWAVDFTGKAWDRFDKEAKEKVKQRGIKYITLAPAEKARWKKLLAPIKEEYAAELDAKGLPGSRILRELRKLAGK
ncbi:MAG: TRAP transporter substrate-binding protein [Deltaproteobacteria bacterium]|nr:TRAP transporter substrate-binding protein [Deltaproteobacteria bacterium]